MSESAAENMLSKENIGKYMEYYQLGEETTIKAITLYNETVDAVLGCGVAKEAVNIDVVFKAFGGRLKVDEDSTSQAVEGGVTQTNEATREAEAKKKREEADKMLVAARKALHGK